MGLEISSPRGPEGVGEQSTGVEPFLPEEGHGDFIESLRLIQDADVGSVVQYHEFGT